MIRSQVKLFQQFSKVTQQVEELAVQGLNAAAHEAAAWAAYEASIDLELEVIPAHDDLDGYAAGIKSNKRSRSDGSRIAVYFDKGTLAGRKAPLAARSRRKDSWPVTRAGTTYTAKRRSLAGGIEAEGFFGKARAAGRRAMLARLRRR